MFSKLGHTAYFGGKFWDFFWETDRGLGVCVSWGFCTRIGIRYGMRSGVLQAIYQLRRRSVIYERVLGFSSCSQGVSSSSQNVSGDGMMKSIELPAYRAFMFAVVPQIMYAPIGCGIQRSE